MNNTRKNIFFVIIVLCAITLPILLSVVSLMPLEQPATSDLQTTNLNCMTVSDEYSMDVNYMEEGVVFTITDTKTGARGTANLEYSISGKNSVITTKMYCSWSTGFPTVKVKLTLQMMNSSGVITDMSTNSTNDLNIFKSITTSSNTYGVTAAWRGVAEVSIDGKAIPRYEGYWINFKADGSRL